MGLNLVQVKGVNKLLTELHAKMVATQVKQGIAYTVGFTQGYAMHVHENHRETADGAGKRGKKYLETPLRQLVNSGELSKIIVGTAKATGDVNMGLKLGALRIKREAMKAVPIDTGALRGSAFVGKGKGEKEASSALAKSNAIKAGKGKK